jgi:thiol:disulfide interchange protein DsbA
MIRVGWLLCFTLLAFPTLANLEETFKEGIHYQRLAHETPTTVGDNAVEVVELFWYGCPHCYTFEPYVNEWLKTKPESVKFIRLPASLNPGWVVHARTYYALEQLGELERVHPLLFLAIHEQGRRLRDIKSITRFVSQQGVDESAFLTAYRSPSVEDKYRRSVQRTKQFGVNGVPALVINGKYLTSARMAGGFGKMLEVVDFLVAKESGNKN